ncbi:filamentous hemagglutinin N-terminal domain-containing protein, partial [Campylobacter lari]|uniref:filamentous hemagglutinin N-terminal domain-containing protein n=1 Tax=Campylobacter lari TaxID=201 RepID=UPI001BDB67A4
GILEAGNNNVFLINPNGVIITKTGTINANRFVASTSSMSDGDMWKFAKSTQAQAAAFSPIFKPQKAGNVVNMGNINANNVLLIGNKVDIQGGHINGKHNDAVSGDALKNPSGNTANKVHLVGNYVDIDLGKINFNSKENLISVDKSARVHISTEDYYNKLTGSKKDPFKKEDGTDNFQKGSYRDVKSKDIEQFASIGSDRDWFFFAKLWNDTDLEIFKLVDKGVAEYRLIGDVDFKGSQGQNYANYCIDGLGCTSMIVGNNELLNNWNDIYRKFSKTFNGQGFTLSDINIDIKDASEQTKIGLFGASKGAIFKNVKVDYNNGGISAICEGCSNRTLTVGSFIGYANNSTFENIEVKKVNNFKIYDPKGAYTNGEIGGFVGSASNTKFNNIALYNFSNIDLSSLKSETYFGGFVGELSQGKNYLNNISLSNFVNINTKGGAGGFIGYSYWEGEYTYKNISIKNFDSIQTTGYLGGFGGNLRGKINIENVYIDLNGGNLYGYYVGGFAGNIFADNSGVFNNIHIKNIGEIHTGENASNTNVGGFVGSASSYNGNLYFNNIILDNIKEISADKGNVGGFAGNVKNADFSNISINNIGRISSNQDGTGAGGFIGFIDATNGDVNIGFKDIALNFNSKGLIQGGDIGGFIGNIINGKDYNDNYYRTNLDFSNIHIYFDPNFSMQYNGMGKGKFVGYYNPNYNTFSFKNKVNFYADDNIFNGATTDKSLWNHFTTLSPNENVFKNNTENITEAINVSVISPEFTHPEKIPDDVEVKLDMDDLYSDVIDSIIKDITKEYFSINIHDLIKILNEYKYENMNEDQKVEFIKTYFINKSKYDKNTDLDKIARSVVQSLDFASVYQGNFSEGKLNASALKEYKNNLAPKVEKINKYKDDVNHFIQTTLNNKVNSINEANENFSKKNYYEEINTLALAYNKYIELINKGLASKDDQAFKDISNKLFALIAQAQDDTEDIKELINSFESLKTQASEKSNGHFIVEGDLQALNILYPILASIKDNNNNNGGGEIDKPEKPIDPIEPPIDNKPDNTDNSLVFKQSSTFNSIGDEAIDDEEEKEIGETDGEQRLITCIVSDNFKTMNPCAVGH